MTSYETLMLGGETGRVISEGRPEVSELVRRITLPSDDEAIVAQVGESDEAANKRNLYKMIHPDGIKSCQLVMGVTELLEGSVWNTMPPHTHDRRMEVYMYFNLPDEHRVFHFMGSPERHK